MAAAHVLLKIHVHIAYKTSVLKSKQLRQSGDSTNNINPVHHELG